MVRAPAGVYQSTYHAKPRSIYFLPQYQRQRKYKLTQLKRNKTFALFTYISAEKYINFSPSWQKRKKKLKEVTENSASKGATCAFSFHCLY